MPLDTTVRHYRSTMNGASTLANAPGSLIKVLDDVLVNGFGNVTLTSLSVTNNIATATVSTGYNTAPYCVVTISGATPSELNGDKKITSSTSTTFTFEANGVSNGTATGTITCRFPGAGWTKPFSNTSSNVAVYRNSTVNGTGFYLQVTENTVGGFFASLVGYESMSSTNEGQNRFPLESQTASMGMYKANSTGRNWWIAADSKTCYIGNEFHGGGAYVAQCGFGDFKSVKPSDPYCYFITARTNATDGISPNSPTGRHSFLSNYTGSTNRILARQANGTVRSKYFNTIFLAQENLEYGLSGHNFGFVYPNLIDNSLFIVPIFIYENNLIRGNYRGIYATFQNINASARFFEEDDVFSDIPTVGRKCLYKSTGLGIQDSTTGNSGAGAFFVDVVGPWE